MTSLASVKRQLHEWRYGMRYRMARVRARPQLPELPARLRPVLDALERDGVALSSLEELGADRALLPALDRIVPGPDTKFGGAKDYLAHASDEALVASPLIVRWGLNEDILALCAAYIGLPVAYRGLTVRRDFADGAYTGTRIWHRDGEDARILKLIVYINDVDEGTGPFECVPKRFAPATWRVDLHDGNRVADADFDRMVPPAQRRACTGPRGTVVVVDTCAVYHRGRVPTRSDRLTAFYCYNSSQPLAPDACRPLFDRSEFLRGQAALSPLQQSALSYRY